MRADTTSLACPGSQLHWAFELLWKSTISQERLSSSVHLVRIPHQPVNNLKLTLNCLAEEGGAGKVALLEKGGYEGMDACLMYDLPLIPSSKYPPFTEYSGATQPQVQSAPSPSLPPLLSNA